MTKLGRCLRAAENIAHRGVADRRAIGMRKFRLQAAQLLVARQCLPSCNLVVARRGRGNNTRQVFNRFSHGMTILQIGPSCQPVGHGASILAPAKTLFVVQP
jgi:hypothetical protein